MVRLVIVILALVISVAPCLAGVGELGLYSDAGGQNCALVDYGGAVVTVYIVQHFYYGDMASGSRFAINVPEGVNWLFLSFQSTFQGDFSSAPNDISLNYGSCIGTATTVGSAQWFSIVAAPSCTLVTFKPADSMPSVIATDCAFNEQTPLFAYSMVVNMNGACICAWATQPSTWGAVKALYR